MNSRKATLDFSEGHRDNCVAVNRQFTGSLMTMWACRWSEPGRPWVAESVMLGMPGGSGCGLNAAAGAAPAVSTAAVASKAARDAGPGFI
jgi:hypothetical protein